MWRYASWRSIETIQSPGYTDNIIVFRDSILKCSRNLNLFNCFRSNNGRHSPDLLGTKKTGEQNPENFPASPIFFSWMMCSGVLPFLFNSLAMLQTFSFCSYPGESGQSSSCHSVNRRIQLLAKKSFIVAWYATPILLGRCMKISINAKSKAESFSSAVWLSSSELEPASG